MFLRTPTRKGITLTKKNTKKGKAPIVWALYSNGNIQMQKAHHLLWCYRDAKGYQGNNSRSTTSNLIFRRSPAPNMPIIYTCFLKVWLGPHLHPVQATSINGLYSNAAWVPNSNTPNRAPPSPNLLARSTN